MTEPADDNKVRYADFPQHSSGNGGGNGMLERIKKLEEQVSTLKVDIAVIKSNYSTKQDVEAVKSSIESVRSEIHQSIATQTKWLAATMVGITGIAMAIARLIF